MANTNDQEKYEIVKFVDNGFELEVNVSPAEDTVWLTQDQMAELFQKSKSTINEHIKNAYAEKEISDMTMRKFGNSELSTKPTNYYNLDVIISVGYRVKSQRGVIFRRWATSVLKQYMIKGYAIDSSRVMVTKQNYLDLVNVVNRIDSTQTDLVSRIEKLEARYPQLQNYVFACGQMYDATSFFGQVVEKAENDIVLIDNYVDRGTMDILSHKKPHARVSIITSKDGNKITPKELNTFNAQYGNLTIELSDKVHDRFLILDNHEMYHIGASLKDAGKKLFGADIIHNPAIIGFVLANSI